uniref:Ion_trans domain-containing protein n=1 Tax=Macrostomum lignano TaxID=282301 RepID=A0A1I8INW8_9PLAT
MGAFRSFWKRIFWKGFVICDGVMTLAHIVLLAIAIFTVVAILRPAKFRLPFLVWKNMFYLIRFLTNVGFCIVIYSYCREISDELSQGPIDDTDFGTSTDKLQENPSDLPMPGNPYYTNGFNSGFHDARNPHDEGAGVYANA